MTEKQTNYIITLSEKHNSPEDHLDFMLNTFSNLDTNRLGLVIEELRKKSLNTISVFEMNQEISDDPLAYQDKLLKEKLEPLNSKRRLLSVIDNATLCDEDRLIAALIYKENYSDFNDLWKTRSGIFNHYHRKETLTFLSN